MTTLETALLIALVIDSLALGGLVLLQQGKGADIGAAFGSGGSNTVFGGAGSTSFSDQGNSLAGHRLFCHLLWAGLHRQRTCRQPRRTGYAVG